LNVFFLRKFPGIIIMAIIAALACLGDGVAAPASTPSASAEDRPAARRSAASTTIDYSSGDFVAATFAERKVDRFIFDGFDFDFGSISISQAEKLGKPLKIEESETQGLENSSEKDYFFKLCYDGLSINLMNPYYRDRDVLVVDEIVVTGKERRMKYGLGVGSSRDDVLKALGLPFIDGKKRLTYISSGFKYDGAADRSRPGGYVNFRLDSEGTVERIDIYQFSYRYHAGIGVNNSYIESMIEERLKIRIYGDLVERDGRKLTLKLKNGDVCVLKDMNTDIDSDSHTAYNFEDYFKKPGYYLVHVQYWEGDEYRMVNEANGRGFDIPAAPNISPGNKRLAAVSASDAYNFNGIEVWRFAKGKMVREWKYAPDEHLAFHFIGWDGDDAFRAGYYSYVQGPDLKEKRVENIHLARRGPAGWKIELEKTVDSPK